MKPQASGDTCPVHLWHIAATDLGAPIRTATGRRTAIQVGRQQRADAYPSDGTQWADSDGDGYGDNPTGTNGDACPSQAGNSTADRYGCLDTDGDGIPTPTAHGAWTMALTLTPTTRTAGATATGTVMTMVWMMIARLYGTSVHDRKDVQTKTGTATPTPTAAGHGQWR